MKDKDIDCRNEQFITRTSMFLIKQDINLVFIKYVLKGLSSENLKNKIFRKYFINI